MRIESDNRYACILVDAPGVLSTYCLFSEILIIYYVLLLSLTIERD